MVTVGCKFSLVGFLLVCGAGPAVGGTYADPAGFSFTYPEGWVAVNKAALGDANQAVPPEMKKWVAKNNLDLNRVAVVLIHQGPGEFLDNLNVVVQQQQIPVNDKAVGELTAMLPKQYEAVGAQVKNMQGRVQKVGSREAVVLDYLMRLPGVAPLLRQRQVMFPGGGSTYIVTCTAPADSFDKTLPTFETVLASFQTPTPASTGFDWKRVGTNAVAWGIAGGLAGLLIALFRKFSGKARRERGDDETAEAEKR